MEHQAARQARELREAARYRQTGDPQDAPEAWADTVEGENWILGAAHSIARSHGIEHIDNDALYDVVVEFLTRHGEDIAESIWRESE